MPSPSTARGLLDLPAEIWSKIGKHVIDITPALDNETVRARILPACFGKIERQPWDPLYQPPITRVCRVVREELLPYYYKTKTLIFWYAHDCIIGGRRDTCAWLKAIGETNRRCVRGFEFIFVAKYETSHDWPFVQFRQVLRTKCGVEVALHKIEEDEG